jgi:hypothetical protein
MDKFFTVGVSAERYDEFDFIIIPTTHLHMTGFTLTEEDAQSDARRAELWVERFERLLALDLPFYKVGIAHLACGLIRPKDRAAFLSVLDNISESDMRRLFGRAAELGCGIELNHSDMSFKDEEAPKILVSAIKPLTEDGRFTESDAEMRSDSPGRAVSRPQAEKPKENGERQKPKAFSKVYLRCPDFTGEVYRKVQNLLDIFDDGSFPAVLYSMQENRYVPCSHGVAMSSYVRKELEALLGEENVVFR